MQTLDESLRTYIETYIFPQYREDTSGHGLSHIQYVIRRALDFAKSENVNLNMIYAAAAFHDIGHAENPKIHEILSAKLFLQDAFMQKYFLKEDQCIIAQAIEDHRASNPHSPRSIYGKILSTADRSTDVKDFLQRTHAYSVEHNPEISFQEHAKRAYAHMKEKYGNKGYAKTFLYDEEYNAFKNEIDTLLLDKKKFFETYAALNLREP